MSKKKPKGEPTTPGKLDAYGIRVLKKLAPPWPVHPCDIRAASQAVGHPIAYRIGVGWQPIAESDAAMLAIGTMIDRPATKPSKPKPPAHESHRLRQLQRMLLMIELLAPLAYGATAAELARDIREDIGTYGERTIRRDLVALETIGLVERIKPFRQMKTATDRERTTKWRWVDRSMRAVIHARTAELHAELTA